MDPVEFLDVARNMAPSGMEAERRTAIGRAYYGTFILLRDLIGAEKWFPGTGEDHECTIYYLERSNDPLMISIAQDLRDLRNARTTADYVMTANVTANDSQMAIKKAVRAEARTRQIKLPLLRAVPRFQPKRP